MIKNNFGLVFTLTTTLWVISDSPMGLCNNQNYGGRQWSINNYRVVHNQQQKQQQQTYRNSYRYQYQYKYGNQQQQQVNYVNFRGNQDYVYAGLRWINRYRQIHRVNSLALDQDLVQRAQSCAMYYAKRGVIDHSCGQKNGAGENLFMYRSSYSYSGLTDATIQAISSWYKEQRLYKNNYYRDPNNFSTAWGHFTALIWASSHKVGLGVASVGSRTVVVSLFYPPGNHLRRFKENVFPPAY